MEKIIDMSAPCDCGEQIRHNNGGNYHQRVLVFKYDKGYAVVLTDTRCRSDFGDQPTTCDECGLTLYERELHFHITGRVPAWVPRLIAESWCSPAPDAEEESEAEEAILLALAEG
jgi:hypothetical protein